MKFKLIIIFFNVFMLLSFLVLFFTPIGIFGWEYISEFWGKNWFFPIIFLFLIIIADIFFIYNMKIVQFAEKGEWSSLVPLLEKRVYEKNCLTYTNIRLLTHSYLILGHDTRINTLERYVKTKNKKLYNKTFLMLSCGHLIGDSPEALVSFMEEAYNDNSIKNREWVKICYAFSLISAGYHDKALQVLDLISAGAKEPVLKLTRLYLAFLAAPISEKAKMLQQREDFVKETDRKKFDKSYELEKGELYILFLSKIINKARDWVYA